MDTAQEIQQSRTFLKNDRKEETKNKTAAEYAIAGTLRRRKSACSGNCGSDGDCTSCNAEAIPSHVLGALAEVEFKGRRRGYYKRPPTLKINIGDAVIVECDRGIDIGTISAFGTSAVRKMKRVNPTPSVLPLVRLATEEELLRLKTNREAEREAISVFRTRALAFDLDLKPVDAEWQLDHQRLSFYFTAPKQVDFRDLVRDLASIFSTRIELRHISAREEARRVGGLGVCGLELCCSTFLDKFEYITIDHAKIQNLQNNNNKLSGQCGRLKCCLLFEVDTYIEYLQNFPPLQSKVMLPDGQYEIVKLDLLRNMALLKALEGTATCECSASELAELREQQKILVP